MLQNDNSWQRVTFEEALEIAAGAATLREHRNLNEQPSSEVRLDLPVVRALLVGVDQLRSGS